MFVYQRYGPAHVRCIRLLAHAGLSDYEIGRRLKMPRSTVHNWRRRQGWPEDPPAAPSRFVATDPGSYAYLLGVYLGDGHLVATGKRTWRLGIYCDARHARVLAEIRHAIQVCAPDVNVCLNKASENGVALFASSPLWHSAFPQHGPGRKHERPIELERWQRAITHAHPEMLLRGLIHSDGCRCMNRFQTKLPSGRIAEYEYPRYFFSNRSADIKQIFCEHCELLGIRWTQPNHRNISVSHRRSVAKLDAFIGPKR
jgi:Homeodomain-like domain-containing protein